MSVTGQRNASLSPADSPPAPVAASGSATADPARDSRHLALMTSDGVAYLAYWMVILILLSQAALSVLRPPGSLAVGLLAGMACLVWSAFCLGTGMLRGTRPDGADRPPPTWLPVIASAGCLVSLELLRSAVGLVGPWPAELVVSGLLVATVTVWAGTLAGGVTAVVLTGLLLALPVSEVPGQLPLRTPLSSAVGGVAIIGAAFGVALALGWMRRTTRQLQATVDARDEALVREQSLLAAARVAAEVERSLHDTALNTLETIAAHGDHLDPQVVRVRCAADVAQLTRWRSESGFAGVGEVLTRLEEHAAHLGLALAVEQISAESQSEDDPPDPLPPEVLHAVAGAGCEALTNVAKHSGVDRATVLVVRDRTGVQLLVADDGVGIGPQAGEGFGVVHSVHERMAAVGGSSLVGPGPADRGTIVALGWQAPRPDPDPIRVDLLTRTAGVVVAVGTLLAGTACALVMLGWTAYALPGLALAAPVVPVLVAAWILNDAKAGVRIGTGHVLAACATYVLVGAIAPLADPYCSSLLGEGVMIDARLALLATVLMLAPRPGVLAALLGTVVTAHLGVALAWNARWVGCGPDTAALGAYVLAAILAVWLFAGRMSRVADEYARARTQATRAEVRIRTQLSVRAEEELWVADTLSSAQELLGAIAEGQLDPRRAATRERCAAEAGYLRALLAFGQAPDPVRRPARIWLRLLHDAGCQVSVRGALADCSPPGRIIGRIGGVLDTVAAMAPASKVTLAAWSSPQSCSLMVTASGTRVAHAGMELAARVHRVAGRGWRDFGPDSITVEWTWPHAAAAGA